MYMFFKDANIMNFWLIDWCLMPTLAIFQLYRGMNKFHVNLKHLEDH
jgi:hypothetical protein